MAKKSIFSRLLNHLNRNRGAYDLVLVTVVAGVAIISLAIALTSLYLNINPPDKKADIQLYTDAPNDMLDLNTEFVSPSFSLYIFNGGTAPCFDVVLTTHSFIQRGEMISPEKKTIPALVDPSNQKTTFYLGVINPDETIKIRLEPIDLSSDQIEYLILKLNPSTLKVECIDDSKTKKIFFKKEK